MMKYVFAANSTSPAASLFGVDGSRRQTRPSPSPEQRPIVDMEVDMDARPRLQRRVAERAEI